MIGSAEQVRQCLHLLKHCFSMRGMEAIKRACDAVGGQSVLARSLDVSAAAVNQWVKGVRPVPARFCRAIEDLTGVSRRDLRPEDWRDWWPELGAPAGQAQASGAGPAHEVVAP